MKRKGSRWIILCVLCFDLIGTSVCVKNPKVQIDPAEQAAKIQIDVAEQVIDDASTYWNAKEYATIEFQSAQNSLLLAKQYYDQKLYKEAEEQAKNAEAQGIVAREKAEAKVNENYRQDEEKHRQYVEKQRREEEERRRKEIEDRAQAYQKAGAKCLESDQSKIASLINLYNTAYSSGPAILLAYEMDAVTPHKANSYEVKTPYSGGYYKIQLIFLGNLEFEIKDKQKNMPIKSNISPFIPCQMATEKYGLQCKEYPFISPQGKLYDINISGAACYALVYVYFNLNLR